MRKSDELIGRALHSNGTRRLFLVDLSLSRASYTRENQVDNRASRSCIDHISTLQQTS